LNNELGFLNLYRQSLYMLVIYPLSLGFLWALFLFTFIATRSLKPVKELSSAYLTRTIEVIWDLFSRKHRLSGPVARLWTESSGSFRTRISITYKLTVSDESFTVSEKLHDWLAVGDEVVVSFWPHSRIVARVENRA